MRCAAGLKTRKFSSLSATMTASPMSDKIDWRISLVRESSSAARSFFIISDSFAKIQTAWCKWHSGQELFQSITQGGNQILDFRPTGLITAICRSGNGLSPPSDDERTNVPGRGLEPLRISPPDPKSGASANFATLAFESIEQECAQFTPAPSSRNRLE